MIDAGIGTVEREVANLRAEGKTIKEIRELTGWGNDAVGRILRDAGYITTKKVGKGRHGGPAPPPWTADEVAVLESAATMASAVRAYGRLFGFSLRSKSAVETKWTRLKREREKALRKVGVLDAGP